jgi:hypothetical protein
MERRYCLNENSLVKRQVKFGKTLNIYSQVHKGDSRAIKDDCQKAYATLLPMPRVATEL